ncbi:hypothetical protein OKW41_009168 [Paraburkholderia sp. UCT70]
MPARFRVECLLALPQNGRSICVEYAVDAFRWVVDTYPYICYDSLRDMVVTVTDDSGYGSDDPDCALLTMRMPDPETLRACYDEHRVRMERAAD